MTSEIGEKRISVIIPMYNAEKTIERALFSVINQSYSSGIEIIVVNDGSTDNSEDVVNQVIKKNNRFNIQLINQNNGGVSKARNTGLKQASGEFIALLDSDDAWFEEKLITQMNLFDTNKLIDFLGTSFKNFGFRNKREGDLIKIDFRDLLFKNYFQPSTILFKREILNKVGFFEESQRYAEEGNYFMRVAKEFNCYFLNSNLITFGDGKAGFGESGLSANLKEMEKGELKNLKFVYDKGWINRLLYIISVSFSLLKYLRRVIIVKFR